MRRLKFGAKKAEKHDGWPGSHPGPEANGQYDMSQPFKKAVADQNIAKVFHTRKKNKKDCLHGAMRERASSKKAGGPALSVSMRAWQTAFLHLSLFPIALSGPPSLVIFARVVDKERQVSPCQGDSTNCAWRSDRRAFVVIRGTVRAVKARITRIDNVDENFRALRRTFKLMMVDVI
jgi:hypothetical protein